MTKSEGTSERGENKEMKIGGEDLIKNRNKFKRNMQRLGGRGGLSLESFANAKRRNDNFNPALIKKQREFYRNAKCVQKYKKSINQREQPGSLSTSKRPLEVENEKSEGGDYIARNKKIKKNARSLQELYERKRAEEEEAKKEREAILQAKKEERQRAEARRKDLKGKMFKKTRSGQPVMKYRIEHLLETIQGPTS